MYLIKKRKKDSKIWYYMAYAFNTKDDDFPFTWTKDRYNPYNINGSKDGTRVD